MPFDAVNEYQNSPEQLRTLSLKEALYQASFSRNRCISNKTQAIDLSVLERDNSAMIRDTLQEGEEQGKAIYIRNSFSMLVEKFHRSGTTIEEKRKAFKTNYSFGISNGDPVAIKEAKKTTKLATVCRTHTSDTLPSPLELRDLLVGVSQETNGETLAAAAFVVTPKRKIIVFRGEGSRSFSLEEANEMVRQWDKELKAALEGSLSEDMSTEEKISQRNSILLAKIQAQGWKIFTCGLDENNMAQLINPELNNSLNIQESSDFLRYQQDYNSLPNKLSVSQEVAEGFDKVWNLSAEHKSEFGGMIIEDVINGASVMIGGESGVRFKLNYFVATQANIETFINRMRGYLERNIDIGMYYDLVFINQKLAERHADILKRIAEIKSQIVFNKEPISIVHGHPSRNLPSPGDVLNALCPDEEGNKMPETIISGEWIYFIKPTMQTPDGFSLGYNFLMKELHEHESKFMNELNQLSPDKANSNEVRNAARLSLLQVYGKRYKLGVYVMKKGTNHADRII